MDKHVTKHKKLFFTLSVSAFLSACSLTPELNTPAYPAAEQWQALPNYDLPSGQINAAKTGWRDFFISQELQSLIEVALANNADLKEAALNVKEARALYRIEETQFVPTVGATAQGSLIKNSDELQAQGRASRVDEYEATLGITAYELDLYGRLQNNSDAALNEFFATQEAQAVVRNALIAETANAYLQLLADRKLLSLTEKTLEAQEHTYDILQKSLEKGASTRQDVSRAATAVETAKVNLHRFTRAVEQDKNALFVLLGVANDDGLLSEQMTLDTVEIKSNLNPGIPSEVLLTRPDIRQAEYTLVSRNASVGAARAAFFPSISLTGGFGYASADLDRLFTGNAFGAWSFIPQINLPIFAGGRLQDNLDIAQVRKELAVVNYEQSIRNAFREVADELAAAATLQKQLDAHTRLVAAAQNVYDLSSARYESGIDSFLSVLDSQRELYGYQQDQIEVERLRLTNIVNLYKVLGGGSYEAEATGQKVGQAAEVTVNSATQ